MISKTSKRTLLPLAPTVLTLLTLATVLLSGSSYGTKPASPAADLVSFSALAPIDVHVHLYKDDPAFGALLKRLNLRVLDIIVIDDRDPYGKGLEPQRSDVLKVVHTTAGRALFCTTFSPYEFEDPGFVQRTARQLGVDFAHGAIVGRNGRVWPSRGLSVAFPFGLSLSKAATRSADGCQIITSHGPTPLRHARSFRCSEGRPSTGSGRTEGEIGKPPKRPR